MNTLSGEETLSNFFASFWKRVCSKRKEFAPMSKFFPFRTVPFSEVEWRAITPTISHESCLPCTNWKNLPSASVPHRQAQASEPPHDKTNEMACAPCKDSEKPGHPPNLIRVFAVLMKKAWVLSYPLSTQQRLWSDWADAHADLSSKGAHLFCWFCHEVIRIRFLCLIKWYVH